MRKIPKPKLRALPKDKHFRKCLKMFFEAGGKVGYDFREYHPLQHPDVSAVQLHGTWEEWKRVCHKIDVEHWNQRQAALAKLLQDSNLNQLVLF